MVFKRVYQYSSVTEQCCSGHYMSAIRGHVVFSPARLTRCIRRSDEAKDYFEAKRY